MQKARKMQKSAKRQKKYYGKKRFYRGLAPKKFLHAKKLRIATLTAQN